VISLLTSLLKKKNLIMNMAMTLKQRIKMKCSILPKAVTFCLALAGLTTPRSFFLPLKLQCPPTSSLKHFKTSKMDALPRSLDLQVLRSLHSKLKMKETIRLNCTPPLEL
jgi:hypothetical protein